MDRTTTAGPPDDLDVPTILLVAVGNWKTGPTPQITFPGLAGEKKSVSWTLPMPPTGETSLKGFGCEITGTMVRVMRFQFSFSENGMTGWMLRTYWVSRFWRESTP